MLPRLPELDHSISGKVAHEHTGHVTRVRERQHVTGPLDDAPRGVLDIAPHGLANCPINDRGCRPFDDVHRAEPPAPARLR